MPLHQSEYPAATLSPTVPGAQASTDEGTRCRRCYRAPRLDGAAPSIAWGTAAGVSHGGVGGGSGGQGGQISVPCLVESGDVLVI